MNVGFNPLVSSYRSSVVVRVEAVLKIVSKSRVAIAITNDWSNHRPTRKWACNEKTPAETAGVYFGR